MPRPTRFNSIQLDDNGVAALDAGNICGGQCVTLTADTTTLLVGDIVYVSGVGIVNKSATVGGYLRYVGVVVSGESLKMELGSAVGTTAATSGQKVMVQVNGIAEVIVGATGFTAATESWAVPSAATAGRVIPGTTADGRVGVILSTQSTAGSAVKMLIKHI